MPKPLPPTPAAAPSSGGDGEGGKDNDNNAGKDEDNDDDGNDDDGNEFEAASNATMPVDNLVETASKKPTSMKGSRKVKATKATPPPVPPDLALIAYGAPSILRPTVPDKGRGRPKLKRIRNKGSAPSDGGTVFKLRPGNKEEPLVDAHARTKRTTAGKNAKYGNEYYR